MFNHVFFSGETVTPVSSRLKLHLSLLEQVDSSVCVQASYVYSVSKRLLIIDDCATVHRDNCPSKGLLLLADQCEIYIWILLCITPVI